MGNRARGDKEYVLPMQGLNSEANLLHFPQEFAVDVLNMEIDYDPQMVRPRKGLYKMSLPRLAETRNLGDHQIAVSSFLWEAVDSDPDVNFVIVQLGRYIYFFNDDQLDDAPAGILADRIDINDLISGTTVGTLALAEATRLNYALVKGKVVICSKHIDPALIQYDGTNITVNSMSLRMRDVQGVEDGLEIEEHPATLVDDHEYNLLNQGWYKQRRLTSGSKVESDPIVEYEAQYTGEFPSNADVVWVGMVDSSGDLVFDAEFLRDQSFGSTPAPRGHYIVDIFNIDREAILLDPQSSGATSGGSSSEGGGVDWPIIPPLILP